MNRGKTAALAILVGLALLSAGALQAEQKATPTVEVKLSVEGMTCGGCVNAVTAALEDVPGVTKAEVSLEKKEAIVTCEEGKTTPEELIKAVEKAGFKASVQKKTEKQG